jgi:hypothetical protein
VKLGYLEDRTTRVSNKVESLGGKELERLFRRGLKVEEAQSESPAKKELMGKLNVDHDAPPVEALGVDVVNSDPIPIPLVRYDAEEVGVIDIALNKAH